MFWQVISLVLLPGLYTLVSIVVVVVSSALTYLIHPMLCAGIVVLS